MVRDVVEWRSVAGLDLDGLILKCMAQKGTLNKLIEVNNAVVSVGQYMHFSENIESLKWVKNLTEDDAGQSAITI